MDAPDTIKRLVDTFDANQEGYRAGGLNETQLRRQFLDPFFAALGWDVENKQGVAEAYVEVVHEDALVMGGATKAPDYAFRVGRERKFFVEAKSPSVNVKSDAGPAFQLRRYAWTAKLPLSVLTDFEEFAVYDSRIQPAKTDKSSVARIQLLDFHDYLAKWQDIHSVFSREAAWRGSFDKYVVEAHGKRGADEVDDAFLKEIESWRDLFARNIALRNPRLSQRELNFAVQRTIDRIIFLRICEDRRIETYGSLQELLNEGSTYKRLCALFYRADEKYNSGLFHFSVERGRSESPDDMTLELRIDDKPLKEVIGGLYYPDCPYEFSVMPANILGQVYEQFLGKVIRLTAGHQARIEEKPEVKKAGGVFYTPPHVVAYIVANTIARLLQGKTPDQVQSLRVLDPACGSGSFLIEAYQYLLDWHLDWYTRDDPNKWSRGKHTTIYEGPRRSWRLTTTERKRILLNNIFGVDIDSQAVEVSKLSLLLKVLEGESEESISQQLKLFRERALPDLGSNIKCGNSLIGPDFYQGEQFNFLDEEERMRINVFDWAKEFRSVTEGGGFDIILGNPPYIPIETMSGSEREFYQKSYPQLERKFDSSIVFILACLRLLRRHGLLGFISSVTWQTGENFSKLREHIFKTSGIELLVNLPFDVFKNAYVDTGIYILTEKSDSSYRIYRYPKKTKLLSLDKIEFENVPADLVNAPQYKIILEPAATRILTRIRSQKGMIEFGDITRSTQGLAGSFFKLAPKAAGETWYKFLEKGQVHRYAFHAEKLLYADLSDKESLQTFYEAEPKLLIRRVISRQDRILATYFDDRMVFKKDINPFIVSVPGWDAKYLLGIINSRLISYLYTNTSSIATKDDFRQTTLAELRRIPIPRPDAIDNETKGVIDSIASLVSNMLELNLTLIKLGLDEEQQRITRQLAAIDDRLDVLVYRLYGLTSAEVAEIISTSTE